MDQKALEYTDVEKYREIFEYEMTEVLLALKGEFAVITGKDTGFSSDAMDSPVKINPMPLPQVSVHEVRLEIPDHQAPVGKIEKLPEVRNLSPAFPALPRVSIPEPEPMHAGSAQFPAIPRVPAVGIQTEFEIFRAEVPNVEISVISCMDFPSQNRKAENKPVSVKVPALPEVGSLHTAEWDCGNILVQIRMPEVPRSINLGISQEQAEEKKRGEISQGK